MIFSSLFINTMRKNSNLLLDNYIFLLFWFLVEVEKTGPYNDGFRHGVIVKRFGRRILVDVSLCS